MKRKTDNFNKFFNKKRNSAVKEEFRQEKKAAKKERKEAIEKHFADKRQARFGQQQDAPIDAKAIIKGAAGGHPAIPGPGAKGKSVAFKGGSPASKVGSPGPAAPHDPNLIPLNKYIAHGGVCSRRDAAELIRLGNVQVNGETITEPGTKVSPSDTVTFNGKKVTISRNFVYILLNKPKDYITTTEDPQGRRTVLDLIRPATTERVFPVGRLDRNTSGVLLLTNDGDLAQKLAHPKHEIKKIYHVSLDKPLTKTDFDKIINGEVELEDGPALVDVLAYADSKDKTQIGLEIHSGRNRIVRRIFEHLGYDVRGLDRVTYAGLTKKNVQRGHWRLLTEKEIRILKYLNSSFKGSPGKGAKATQRDQEAQAAKEDGAGWDDAAATPAPAGPGKKGSAGTGKINPAKAATDADDEGWQDPADINWDDPAAAGWVNPADTAWDARPDPSAKRIAKRDVDRYTKDQMARKLPGKKKPPTVTRKESSNEITEADRDFADRKGYSGEKKTSEDRRPSSGKDFPTNRRGPKGRSFGAGKPPYKVKDTGWDQEPSEDGTSGKPPYRGKSGGSGDGKPPYKGKSNSGPGRTPYSGRPEPGAGKPPYRGKSASSDSRPPYSRKADSGSDEGRPPYRGRPESGDSGEGKPPYRGKAASSDSKPPYRGKKTSASGKPPYRGNGKPAASGKNFSSDKPPYKGKSAPGERPPYRGKAGAAGEGKPPYKGKSSAAGKGFSSDKTSSPRGKSSFKGKSSSGSGKSSFGGSKSSFGGGKSSSGGKSSFGGGSRPGKSGGRPENRGSRPSKGRNAR